MRRLLGSFGCAVQLSMDVETMSLKNVDNVVGIVSVVRHAHRVAVCHGAVDPLAVAGLEGRQEPSTRLKSLGKVRDDGWQSSRGSMDEGVPSQQATQAGRRHRQILQSGDLEAKVRVGTSGDVDHAWGKVDAEDFQVSSSQVGADAAGSTAGVEYGSEPRAGAAVGKAVDHRNVQARFRIQGWQATGVVGSDRVVSLLRLREVIGNAHEQEQYGRSAHRPRRTRRGYQCLVASPRVLHQGRNFRAVAPGSVADLVPNTG